MVSIHAPVMDANDKSANDYKGYVVSIHAPVMDANDYFKQNSDTISFNPRARDGREHIVFRYTFFFGVSIHAPVMDANYN